MDPIFTEIRIQLFTDFEIAPEKAQRILRDIEDHPEKAPQYRRFLAEHLQTTVSKMEDMKEPELFVNIQERIREWQDLMGPASFSEIIAMGKQWNVSIDRIVGKDITPELIRGLLDVFIVGQEEYKVRLSLAFYTYWMKRTHPGLLPKSNLLVCGPSGSGKTFGMQVLCDLFHVPFALVHCNNVVQEGIIGPSLTSPFTLLMDKWSEEDLRKTVVCFDEFDKLFEEDGARFNARTVNELLNIIDDKGELEFQGTDGRNSRIKIPTAQMMFVFTGVFDGIREEKRKKRRQRIGFNVPEVEQEPETVLKKELTDEDFIRFGIKPELLGRIQNFVVIDALTEDDLFRLLNMGSSPFAEFEQYFAFNDIQAILTEEGKRTLAHLAKERGLGVRGLKGLLQQALMEDMYDLEVGEDRILRVTRQYIYDNLK